MQGDKLSKAWLAYLSCNCSVIISWQDLCTTCCFALCEDKTATTLIWCFVRTAGKLRLNGSLNIACWKRQAQDGVPG